MSNATRPDASEVEYLQHTLAFQQKQAADLKREIGRTQARLRRLQTSTLESRAAAPQAADLRA